MTNLINAVLIAILTLLSGYFDSRGFLNGSLIWDNGYLVVDKLLKSAGGFGLGILFYWIALRQLKELNVAFSTEVQALGWFSVTMIGIAVTSGAILRWPIMDRIISIIVFAGLTWLVYRGH